MDDEAPICELAVELLGREGYYVGTAADGREAIRCYVQAQQKGRPYDVVILDLTVRDGMGGRETVKELKKIDPDVRAIVSSGYSQDPTISRFRSSASAGGEQTLQRDGDDAGDRAGDCRTQDRLGGARRVLHWIAGKSAGRRKLSADFRRWEKKKEPDFSSGNLRKSAKSADHF